MGQKMAQKPLSHDVMQEAVNAFAKTGNKRKSAELLNIPEGTYNSRYRAGVKAGIKPTVDIFNKDLNELNEAHNKIRQLEATIHAHEENTLTAEYIKTTILKMSKKAVSPPNWLIKPSKGKRSAGVPTLFASDWHWGEVVDPNQINGVNEYNVAIAQDRAKVMIEKTIDLLKNHVALSDYPGIVFVLGGDMVSGDIHEELMATNSMEIMPTVIDLFGVLTWCIETLANEFGNVFVPCVSGNHGRNTHKIRAKGRNFTSFDWLLYQFLSKRFENDTRVQFHIPDGSDAYYLSLIHI